MVSAIENLQSKYKMGDNKRLLHIEKIHAKNKEVCLGSLQCYGVPLGNCVICILTKKDYNRNSVVLYGVTLQSVTGEGKKWVWKRQ